MLLVRKAGMRFFMQAGSKIEDGENAHAALCRELREEIGMHRGAEDARHLGRFRALAANEAGRSIVADLHIRTTHRPVIAAEIAEALWVFPAQAESMPLAPLTRHHVLRLARSL